MKKKGRWLVFLLLLFIGSISNVYAASISISASSTTVTTGGSVKITVRASDLAGKFSVTSSNSNVLAGGTNSVWLENESQSYTFSAKSIGSATITIKALDVADNGGNSYSGSKSVTINVVKPREKSTNNDLKSLAVDGYQITPNFDKDTLEYSVNLESSIEKIKINATKADSYASLTGTGDKEVIEGDNKFEIVVTSETGQKKTYILNAIVQDSNPIVISVNSNNYTLVKRESALVQPFGFELTQVTINNTLVPAFYNELLDMTLVGLKNDVGVISLFRYQNNEYLKFDTFTSTAKTIIFEDVDLDIDHFTKKNVVIDNVTYQAYVSDYDDNYVLIYGIDLETGEKNLYLYDISNQTIQVYIEKMISSIDNNFSQLLQQYKYIILGLSGLSVVLLLVIVLQIASKNKLKKRMNKKIKSLIQKKEETSEVIETKELPITEDQIVDDKHTDDLVEAIEEEKSPVANNKKKQKPKHKKSS